MRQGAVGISAQQLFQDQSGTVRIARLRAQPGQLQIGGRVVRGQLDGLLQRILGERQFLARDMRLRQQAQCSDQFGLVLEDGAEVRDGLIGILVLQRHGGADEQGIGVLVVLRQHLGGQRAGLVGLPLAEQERGELAARPQPGGSVAIQRDQLAVDLLRLLAVAGLDAQRGQGKPKLVVVGVGGDEALQRARRRVAVLQLRQKLHQL